METQTDLHKKNFMKKQFSQIGALVLLVVFAVACDKKIDKPVDEMPGITHNAAECPKEIEGDGALESHANGVVLLDKSSGQRFEIDGKVHSAGDKSYQGGCRAGGIHLNMFNSSYWARISITPASDGGSDVVIKPKGKAPISNHFPPKSKR